MTALALREDQTEWDKRQLAVLEANGIDQDVSEAELAAFLHECQRRKLDPFSRQIYLIGRKDRTKGRKVYRSQTSIDGFRLIARRAADKSGIDYSYEDTIWYDAEGGRHDIWLSDQPPAGAKVVVVRNGSRFDAVARYGAYVQTDWNGNPQGLWKNMPDVLIAKCAEALALRKAFPEDLGGIYTEEEMAQADNPQRVAATAEVVSEERADPAMSDEHWYTQPSPEQEWLAQALEAAPGRDLDGCKADWQTAVKHVNDGTLTRQEAGRLQDVLRPRIKTLMDAEQQASEPPCESDVVEGVIVPDLPEDWRDKIADITDGDAADAVIAEATRMLGAEEMDADLYARITVAVEGRLDVLGVAGRAAA